MLIIVPVRNLVLFPGTVVPVAINRERSLAAAQEAVRAERKVGFLLQHDPDLQSPTGQRSVQGRHGREHRALCDRPGRHASPRRAGRAPLPRARLAERSAVHGRARRVPARSADDGSEVEARALNLKRLSAEAVVAVAAGAGRARERDPGGRVAVDARRPGRELHGHQADREAAAAGERSISRRASTASPSC